jgi:adenosylcobyric acid synthase
MQAEACGVACSSDMNPVLLKPTGNMSSQVVLNGKPTGNTSASDYFLNTDRQWLFSQAMEAYHRLSIQYNPMVIEGAGSIAEVNLWDKDITNMRVALATGAAVYLVADIDRGGVFASVYGTIQLLPEVERQHIKGIIINKFRGDISLFTSGKKILEDLTGIPVVGIIPWFRDIYLDDEDSVAIDAKMHQQAHDEGKVTIAVVLLRHMSNFTDFNYLERLSDVHLYYAATPADLAKADVVIIPGTKNTIADMQYLRSTGMAQAILKAHDGGTAVYGICGGYQIMGMEIADPLGVEGDIERMPGLGLLPVVTTMTRTKITEQRTFQFLDNQAECQGYEIHMGHTVAQSQSPLCLMSDGQPDGYYLNPRTWGTYLHGILDNEVVVNTILQHVGVKTPVTMTNLAAFKDEQYDKLAAWVRDNVDMDKVYESLVE